MKVVFIEDFATKKKGDNWECNNMLGRKLLDKKVAKVYKKVTKKDVSN